MNIPSRSVQIFPIVHERRYITRPGERLTFVLPPHAFDTTTSNINFRLVVGTDRNDGTTESDMSIVNMLRTDLKLNEVLANFPESYAEESGLKSIVEPTDTNMTPELWSQLLRCGAEDDTHSPKAEAYGGVCPKFIQELFQQVSLSSPQHGLLFKEEDYSWRTQLRALKSYADKLDTMTTFYISEHSRKPFLNMSKVENTYEGFEFETTIPLSQLADFMNPSLTRMLVLNASTPDAEPVGALQHFPANMYQQLTLDFLTHFIEDMFPFIVYNTIGQRFYLNQFIDKAKIPKVTMRDISVNLKCVHPSFPFAENFLNKGDTVSFQTVNWQLLARHNINPRNLTTSNRLTYNVGTVPTRAAGVVYTPRYVPSMFMNPGIKTFQLIKGTIASSLRIPNDAPIDSIPQLYDEFLNAMFPHMGTPPIRVPNEFFKWYFSGFVKYEHGQITTVEDTELRQYLGVAAQVGGDSVSNWGNRIDTLENRTSLPDGTDIDFRAIHELLYITGDGIGTRLGNIEHNADTARGYAQDAQTRSITAELQASSALETAMNAETKADEALTTVDGIRDDVDTVQKQLDGTDSGVELNAPTIEDGRWDRPAIYYTDGDTLAGPVQFKEIVTEADRAKALDAVNTTTNMIRYTGAPVALLDPMFYTANADGESAALVGNASDIHTIKKQLDGSRDESVAPSVELFSPTFTYNTTDTGTLVSTTWKKAHLDINTAYSRVTGSEQPELRDPQFSYTKPDDTQSDYETWTAIREDIILARDRSAHNDLLLTGNQDTSTGRAMLYEPQFTLSNGNPEEDDIVTSAVSFHNGINNNFDDILTLKLRLAGSSTESSVMLYTPTFRRHDGTGFVVDEYEADIHTPITTNTSNITTLTGQMATNNNTITRITGQLDGDYEKPVVTLFNPSFIDEEGDDVDAESWVDLRQELADATTSTEAHDDEISVIQDQLTGATEGVVLSNPTFSSIYGDESWVATRLLIQDATDDLDTVEKRLDGDQHETSVTLYMPELQQPSFKKQDATEIDLIGLVEGHDTSIGTIEEQLSGDDKVSPVTLTNPTFQDALGANPKTWEATDALITEHSEMLDGTVAIDGVKLDNPKLRAEDNDSFIEWKDTYKEIQDTIYRLSADSNYPQVELAKPFFPSGFSLDHYSTYANDRDGFQTIYYMNKTRTTSGFFICTDVSSGDIYNRSTYFGMYDLGAGDNGGYVWLYHTDGAAYNMHISKAVAGDISPSTLSYTPYDSTTYTIPNIGLTNFTRRVALADTEGSNWTLSNFTGKHTCKHVDNMVAIPGQPVYTTGLINSLAERNTEEALPVVDTTSDSNITFYGVFITYIEGDTITDDNVWQISVPNDGNRCWIASHGNMEACVRADTYQHGDILVPDGNCLKRVTTTPDWRLPRIRCLETKVVSSDGELLAIEI